MARRASGAGEGEVQAPGQGREAEPGKMPPSELRNALQMLHFHLLFNEKYGIKVSSALASIREELDVSPRLALSEAMRMGLVEEDPESPGGAFVRRGPRSDEVLRRIYDDEPPTRESLLARARAWDRHFAAQDARLAAIREAARPTEANTVGSLPAWMP